MYRVRFVLSIIAMVYLVASTGATVHLHYCMGRIANVGLVQHQDKVCGLCGMEKSSDGDTGCCTDETETIKITVDQKTSPVSLFRFEQPFTELWAAWVPILPVWTSFINDKVQPVSHAPPRSLQVPVYLMHSVFRI